MTEKFKRASDYNPEFTALVKRTCLEIATRMGDYMQDVVIVGGLVPSLIINLDNYPELDDVHVGTTDLDMGFHLAILNEKRYCEITARLRSAGFSADTNKSGKLTRQCWRNTNLSSATIDFLISPSRVKDKAGTLKNIEKDFAAIIVPGLELAFNDIELVNLSGTTLDMADANRNINVCGPGAFIVLKALAFESRSEEKDAYDLFHILKFYGKGPEDVAKRIRPILKNESTKKAIEILKNNFTEINMVGPRRVANFLTGGVDENIQADVVGFITKFLKLILSEEKTLRVRIKPMQRKLNE